MPPEAGQARRPWWIGAAVTGFGACFLAGALQLPMTDPNAGLGAGGVPLLIGAALVLVGVGLVVEALRGVPFASQDAEDVAADQPPSYRALSLATAAAFLPLLTMRPLGFVITATACFALVAAAFGTRRHAIDLLIGAILSLACWWGFGALGIDLGALVPLLGS